MMTALMTQRPGLGGRPNSSPMSSVAPAAACFTVTADADPGMLARVMEPIVKRGLVLDRVDAVLDHGTAPTYVIDMQVCGLDEAAQDVVAAVLKQVVGVQQVLACHKASGL